MFKTNNIKDERVTAEVNNIFKNAAVIMFCLLGISTFVKTYILHYDFHSELSDFIITLVAGTYTCIHLLIKGIMEMGFKGKNSKVNLARAALWAVLMGLIFSASIGILNWLYYKYDVKMLPGVIVFMFFEFTILSFCLCLTVDYISRKRNEKIEKQNNSDED